MRTHNERSDMSRAKSRFRWGLLALILACCVRSAFTSIRTVPRDDLIRRPAFIGVVRVQSTRYTQEADLPYPERLKHLVQEATLLVLQPIKGQLQAATLSVAFDNSQACPNVQYATGETYLV